MVTLGQSDLEVFPLCLGGNVFGWTADEEQSFTVLDAYLDAGGNFIDTADSYSAFAPGLSGGESETVLGTWLQSRGNRDQIVLATKVGRMPGLGGLAPKTIAIAIENSLRRLRTDYIDLYWAHADDPDTPLLDTLRAFDELIKAGTVRHIAASNYSAVRLEEALRISEHEGLARFIALQPQYSLVERDSYEGALAEVCLSQKLSCVPYWALARGFLTGKYRRGRQVDGPRSAQAAAYLDERGIRILGALDEVAAAHETTVAAVALAWVAAQPGVAAPLASARNTQQLAEALPMAGLSLTQAELTQLTDATVTEAVRATG
jgi:aryl-alcohol dehydrogenase-like predicted oxidoreductase